MNKSPIPHSPAHGAALEQYRLAEARLFRLTNHETVINGLKDEGIAKMPEFQVLVAARDDARRAVVEADPKVTSPKSRKAEE